MTTRSPLKSYFPTNNSVDAVLKFVGGGAFGQFHDLNAASDND
jgi:hypothetical protein